MTSLRFPQITDELLSAYIDEAVTEEEKTLVETAVADEPAIAWRLETLRQTVTLLRTMPAVALPRSFVLSEAQLAATSRRQRADVPRGGQQLIVPPWAGFWMAWRAFWSAGSPLLRNAAAASLVTLLFLLAGDLFLTQPQRGAAPGAAGRPAAEVALVVTPTQSAVAPTPVAAAAEPETVAAQPAAPTTATTAVQGLRSAEEPTATPADSLALGVAPSPAPQPTLPPSTGAMRPPGPDEGVELAPEGAGGALFSEGREPGPALESMAPAAAASADSERVTAASAANEAPETAVVGQAMTESASAMATVATADDVAPAAGTNITVVTQTIETETETLSLAAPISATVAPSALLAATDVVTTTIMTTTVVTTTTVSTALPAQEEAAMPTSLSPQAKTPTVAGDALPSPGAAAQVGVLSLLKIFQISLAFLALLFGMLWWRSRAASSKAA